MKQIVPIIAAMLVFMATGCSSYNDMPTSQEPADPAEAFSDDVPSLPRPEIGGLYLLRDDSGYHVAKVLAVDPQAVHLRLYRNHYRTAPARLSSRGLNLLTGHTMIDRMVFMHDNPRLLQVEAVQEGELVAYNQFVQEMNR
jgi:hypothetical protein